MSTVLNLPICGVTAAMVAIFLDLKVPKGSFKEKLLGLDWLWVILLYKHLIINDDPRYLFSSGNTIIVAATTCIVLALTWGGVTFPWNSAQVLVPLILGIILLPVFFIYEAKVPKTPLVSYTCL